MKRFLLLLCAVFLQTQPGFSRQGSILEFHPHADSVCQRPPIDRDLAIVCRKKIAQRYVTFVGLKGDTRVLLAAVTIKPFDDPRKSISLTVDFNGIRPNTGEISTWTYVYDRNGDGKIDYLALVGGACAFKPDDFPESFPERTTAMTADQADYFVGHCRIVFNHWADDNFDGKIDAGVQIDMDPRRDWVDRRIVVRSTKFDGRYDDAWAFRTSIDEQPDSVQRSPAGVLYHPIGKPEEAISQATFDDKTAILRLVNEAAKACKLGAANFYPARETE